MKDWCLDTKKRHLNWHQIYKQKLLFVNDELPYPAILFSKQWNLNVTGITCLTSSSRPALKVMFGHIYSAFPSLRSLIKSYTGAQVYFLRHQHLYALLLLTSLTSSVHVTAVSESHDTVLGPAFRPRKDIAMNWTWFGWCELKRSWQKQGCCWSFFTVWRTTKSHQCHFIRSPTAGTLYRKHTSGVKRFNLDLEKTKYIFWECYTRLLQ